MWAWLAIPWVRKLGEVCLLLAALAAVVLHIYHAGERSGQQAEAGKETEAAHAQFTAIEQTLGEQLAAGREREAQLSQMAQKFADLATEAASRVDTARSASAEDSAKVKALPDSAVKSDLELKAGGPLENLAVLRHVDDVVTDYPHKLEELKATEDGLAALNSRVDVLTQSVQNMTGERDSAVGAFNQLVPLYAQAYNAAIAGHRKWYCAFLCKPKNRIKLPDPISISATLKKGVTK